jgi:hypothetical protein
MQGFIDCIHEDDVLYNPDSVINTLILNVNVGVNFPPQLCILLQPLLYKYTILINLFFFQTVLNIEEFEQLKGKCALGPFLSILVIECQHKCLNVNQCPWMNKVQI